MPRAATSGLVSEQRVASRDPSEAFVPLRLVVREQVIVPEGTPGAQWTRSGQWVVAGDVILDVGGRWDRELDDFSDDDGDHGHVEITVHPGQVKACEWFAGWLEDWINGVADEDEDFSAIFSGGQRAGKTWVGVALCVAFCLAVPDAIVWIVCPTEPSFHEIHKLLTGPNPLLATSWYKKTGDTYDFVNGAELVLRSGHDAEALKVGGAHLILVNECQRQSKKVESVCRMRVADYGGMVLGAANPPDKPIGEWVGDWVAETESGERAGVHFWFNPYENPHADHRRFDALQTQMDDREFATEVLGKFYSVGDVVFYNWDRLVNETTLPKLARMFGVDELRDITALITKEKFGKSFPRVLGVDVQKRPMASVEYRFFENPLAPMSAGGKDWMSYCLCVITDECYVNGEEEDLAQEWETEKKWDPEETLLICDASAKWQFAERDPNKVKRKREEVKGRGSWAVFKRAGYRHIRNPDSDMEKNPDIIERFRATTSKVKTSAAGDYGQHFLFALSKCKKTTKAIRALPNTHGRPSRTSQHSHAGDCVSYPIHRMFPRRHRPKGNTIKIVRVPPPRAVF